MTEMRKPFEYYQTPEKLVKACVDYLLKFPHPEIVVDAGAGEGQWGVGVRDHLYPPPVLIGVDDYFTGTENDRQSAYYNDWVNVDFLDYEPDRPVDWVIGNPPFSLATEFIIKGLSIVKRNGIVAFTLPHAFPYSNKRVDMFWFNNRFNPNYNKYFVEMACINPRPSFTGDGKTSVRQDFALYVFQNNTKLGRHPTIHWLKW